MLWVYVLFLLCYAPFLGVSILGMYKEKSDKIFYVTLRVEYTLMHMNSFLNPILYCAKIRPIRKAMLTLIPATVRSILHISIPQ